MLIKLTTQARITHAAGDVVDVPESVFSFLVSIKAAVPVEAEPAPEPAKPKAKKKAKKTEA